MQITIDYFFYYANELLLIYFLIISFNLDYNLLKLFIVHFLF